MADRRQLIKDIHCVRGQLGKYSTIKLVDLSRVVTLAGIECLLEEQDVAHDFFDWLACSVVLADDFETNPGFYREVICRKLVRLGMLKLEDGRYVLPNPEEWRREDERNAD